MMKDLNQLDDEHISKLVQSVRHPIPETIEARLSSAMRNEAETEGFRFWRYLVWVPLTAVAALLVFTVISFYQPFGVEESKVSDRQTLTEIKTEMELPGKNIKIIWVQKQDFELRR